MSVQGKITLVKRWIGIVLGTNRVAVEQSQGKNIKKITLLAITTI